MPLPPALRIQSDGNGIDTLVTKADGTKLDRVKEVEVRIEAGQINSVHLTVLAADIDVHAHPATVWLMCPCCQEPVLHECEQTLGE